MSDQYEYLKRQYDLATYMEHETKQDKIDRARTLFIESVLKPDTALRACAHNQQCYNELMEIRSHVLKQLGYHGD